MKKKLNKKKAVRKTNAVGSAILADLKEFADALKARIPLDSKYIVRRVRVPEPPTQKR